MDGVITKGLGISLAVVFLVVALLIFGQLSTGAGSFWYGLNNPNVTGASQAVQTIQQTALPILLAIGIAAGLVMAILKAMGVF